MSDSRPSVLLPAQFAGASLSTFVAGLVASCPNGWPPVICLDFANLNFIRPTGAVFLSNLIWWLHEQGTKVQLANINRDASCLRYLDDSLFFEQHCGAKVWANSSPRSTTKPLIRIAHSHSHAWLGQELVPWLSARTSKTQTSFYQLKACLSELFNNIKDHTRFDIGSIFVQHYPRENGMDISLADFGLGIPAKVRETIPGLSDADAVVQAVQEGFTSKSTPRNAGLGLDSLLKTVVGTNIGEVTIYSLNAIVRFRLDAQGQIRPFPIVNVGFCPGTTIEIKLRTDLIEQLPDEREELEW